MSENNNTTENSGSRKKPVPFYSKSANYSERHYHKERFNRFNENYDSYRYNQGSGYYDRDRRDYNRGDQRFRRSRWDDSEGYRPRERSKYSSKSPDFNRSVIYRDYDKIQRNDRNKDLKSKSPAPSSSSARDTNTSNKNPAPSGSSVKEVNAKVQRKSSTVSSENSVKETHCSEKEISKELPPSSEIPENKKLICSEIIPKEKNISEKNVLNENKTEDSSIINQSCSTEEKSQDIVPEKAPELPSKPLKPKIVIEPKSKKIIPIKAKFRKQLKKKTKPFAIKIRPKPTKQIPKSVSPDKSPPTNDNSISSSTDFEKESSVEQQQPKARSPVKNKIPTIPKSSLIFQKSSKFIPIEQYKRQFGISLVRKPFEAKKTTEESKIDEKEKEPDTEPQRPRIFLTPISKLLKSPEELEQEKQNFIKENQQNNADPKIPSTLLNQVNRMDKDGLKNIINNPLSKFDAALKFQARKRLSSELREKLRSLNTEEQNSESTQEDFEFHDDIIEASKLPPELLEELTKILKEEDNKEEENMPETVEQTQAETPPPTSKSPDLMSRIQTAEAAKTARRSCESDTPVTSSSPKKIETLPQSYRNDNAVVITTSDSSSDEEEPHPTQDKYELNSHNILRKFQDDVLPLVCSRVQNKFKTIIDKENDIPRALRFVLRFYLSNLTDSEKVTGGLIKRLHRSINSNKDKKFALDFLFRKTPKLIDRLENTNSERILKSIQRNSKKSNHHEISSTSTPMLTPEKTSASTSSESSEQSTGLSNKMEINEGDVKDNEITTASKKSDEFVIVADNTEDESSEDEGDESCQQTPATTTTTTTSSSSPSTMLNASLMELNNLKILTLMKENQISDVVLSNVKQLDAQIMETQHRKMYIEENILRLQKDKMEADMQIMRLQNEKFILLSTSLPQKDDFNKIHSTPKPVKRRRTLSVRQTPKTPVTTNPKKRRTNSERSTDNGCESQTKESPVVEDNTFAKLKEGSFTEHNSPIVIMEIVGNSILAASEEGCVYKYNIFSKKLEGTFTKHTQTITQLMVYSKFFIITTSLDGHIKQTTIENFGLELQSIDVHEPIQSLDISWDIAFMGSRWGNVFTYNMKKNKLSQTLLCTIDSSVIALKCTTEGPRRILIVSSKGNGINFRDATSGLLLRSIEIPNDLYVNSLLLLGGYLYCGTQKNSIYKFYFSSGEQISVFNCGNGISTIKLFKNNFLMLGCYDGFIYVVDKENGDQIGRIPGAGKMVLGLAIAGDKIISSSKDNAMEAINVPSYFLNKLIFHPTF